MSQESCYGIQESILPSLSPLWNLIDDDYAQGSIVLIAGLLGNSAPIFDLQEIQANELNAVLPAHAFFHELAHPPDEDGFTAAWDTVYYIQQGLFRALVVFALLTFQVVQFQTFNEVSKKCACWPFGLLELVMMEATALSMLFVMLDSRALSMLE